MPNVSYHADIDEMSGKQGGMVYTRARSGPTRRSLVVPMNPRTPAQSQARANLSHAATAFRALSPTDATLWRAYADTQTARNPLTGQPYVPAAVAVFTGLSSKFLQITPHGAIPTTPPASGFAGDRITVTAGFEGGQFTFSASGANAAGVQTELLLQPLKGANWTPQAGGYRAQRFVAFASGSLSVTVPLAAGFYAPAYRFVDPATGQDSPLVTLPVVEVGAG